MYIRICILCICTYICICILYIYTYTFFLVPVVVLRAVWWLVQGLLMFWITFHVKFPPLVLDLFLASHLWMRHDMCAGLHGYVATCCGTTLQHTATLCKTLQHFNRKNERERDYMTTWTLEKKGKQKLESPQKKGNVVSWCVVFKCWSRSHDSGVSCYFKAVMALSADISTNDLWFPPKRHHISAKEACIPSRKSPLVLAKSKSVGSFRSLHLYRYLSMHLGVYLCIIESVYLCIYVSMYLYMDVSIYIYIYIYSTHRLATQQPMPFCS